MNKFLSLLGLLCLCSTVFSAPIEDNEIEESTTGDEEIDLSGFDRSLLYRNPDNQSGEAVARWSPDVRMNPEEMGNYLEGDILMPPSSLRNGLALRSTRWPGGRLPFVIHGTFSKKDQAIINQAVAEYHSKTCIRFVRRTTETDYIAFTNANSGCWSSVGRVGGKQDVNLQSPNCLTQVGTTIHEVLHALGFLHEQNRSDRDSYVTVNWNNIQSGLTNNFDKASPATTTDFGVRYDYGSVMHYSAYAFSKNGQPTIIARSSRTSNMGQRSGFSSSDLAKLNKMYGCSRRG